MSAYIAMTTTFTDKDCLVQSLQSMGFAPEVRAKARHLVDSVGKTRPETAEIVITREQVGDYSNEIGFKAQADGTWLRISSEFDNRSNRIPEAKLKLRYAENMVQKDAASKGLRLVERIAGEAGASRFVFEPIVAR